MNQLKREKNKIKRLVNTLILSALPFHSNANVGGGECKHCSAAPIMSHAVVLYLLRYTLYKCTFPTETSNNFKL